MLNFINFDLNELGPLPVIGAGSAPDNNYIVPILSYDRMHMLLLFFLIKATLHEIDLHTCSHFEPGPQICVLSFTMEWEKHGIL